MITIKELTLYNKQVEVGGMIYPVPDVGVWIEYSLPVGSVVKHCAVRDNVICVYVEVNTDLPMGARFFRLFETNERISKDNDMIQYVGTVLMTGGSLVYHIYGDKE